MSKTKMSLNDFSKMVSGADAELKNESLSSQKLEIEEGETGLFIFMGMGLNHIVSKDDKPAIVSRLLGIQNDRQGVEYESTSTVIVNVSTAKLNAGDLIQVSNMGEVKKGQSDSYMKYDIKRRMKADDVAKKFDFSPYEIGDTEEYIEYLNPEPFEFSKDDQLGNK